MGAFEYTALQGNGKQEKGVLEGDTSRQIRQQLRERGLSPLTVTEVQKREKKQKESSASLSLFQRKISAGDLALVSRQFATMVSSGMPIEESLRSAAQQTQKPRLKSMMMAVRSRVMEGFTLATALADFPHVFDDLYRATIAAGEQSGHLGLVLERLADYTESRQALRQKVKLAMIYPIILTLVAIVVVVLLVMFVVPKVVKVFENMGQELPALTRGLIAFSDFLAANGLYLFLFIIVGAFMGKLLLQRTGPKRYYHKFLLKLPLISRVVKGVNTGQFARTFSILTASGVPVLEGLRISAQVVANLPMKEAVEDAARQVREGAAVHRALDVKGYFPPMMINLISSGEASGRLEEMLERSAVSQERELEGLLAALVGVFEPMMILVMGGVVLLIVMAILLPIFNMNQLVG